MDTTTMRKGNLSAVEDVSFVQDEEILRILEKHKRKQGALISILGDIQRLYGYLPRRALQFVSEKTEFSITDIYGVVTFYQYFRLKPRGKHFISICQGTSCHVRGAPAISKEFEKKLGVRIGETTQDRAFTVESVNCVGACALGPILVIDGKYYPQAKKNDVERLIQKVNSGVEGSEVKDKRNFPIKVACPHCNHSLMDENHRIDELPSIGVTISFQRKHGWFKFSSLYGSYKWAARHEIPENTIVDFFCPHCHSSLDDPLECPVCSAPMISMLVQGGGRLQVCSARGCKHHQLDLW